MTKLHNKKNTHKRTHKRRTYKRRTYKRRTYKRRTYKRSRRIIPNSTVSIFSAPEKIVIDTEHNKSGNIIPGLRTYLGNV
jgi:hypothetical protein